MTYARRYAITAMLGMVTEDDDGEAAKRTPNSPMRPKTSYNNGNGRRDNERHNAQPQQKFADQNAPASPDDGYYLNLEGVNFQRITTQDGQECIIATGNTQPNKTTLANDGFRWNPQRKYWWKYADAV